MMARKAKQKPEDAGLTSLREAAAQLGITRAALLRMIDRGLPAPLVRERRMVDVETARSFMAAQASEHTPPAMAAQLHPDDPRAIQAATAARVKALKLALDTGAMVSVESAAKVMADALATLNSKLSALPSMVVPAELNRDNARANIGAALADVLEAFQPDDASQWQDSPFESAPDDDADEFEDRIYLPLLPDSDPRAAGARVATQKLRHQLDALQRSSVAVADARRIMREQSDKVREAVNKIPGLVAKRLNDGDPAHVVRTALDYEIDAARHSALIALGARPSWKPSPPVAPDADGGGVDEVDGDPDAAAVDFGDA